MTRATILLVEDNVDIADVSAALLREYDYEVHIAHTAQDAMAKLTEVGNIDILFSDIRLGPGGDGIALASELAAIRPDIPIVLTTGYSSSYARPMTVAWTLIRKPYSCKALVEVFERLLKATEE